MLDFVRRCFEFRPEQRITALEAIRHPFLADILQTSWATKLMEPLQKIVRLPTLLSLP